MVYVIDSLMENGVPKYISARVRKILSEKKITQTKLCEMADIQPGYLSELLSNKKRWNDEVLDDIANALNIPVSALMGVSYDQEDLEVLEKIKTLNEQGQEEYKAHLDWLIHRQSRKDNE